MSAGERQSNNGSFQDSLNGISYTLPPLYSQEPGADVRRPGGTNPSPNSVQGGDGTTEDDTITYLTGLNANGTVASKSFATWDIGRGNTANGDGFYRPDSAGVFKWNADNTSTTVGSLAGSAGGTLSYYFDPNANWTASERLAFSSGLEMWQAVANISFTETQNASAANLTFRRNTSNEAYFQASDYTQPSVGDSTLYHPGYGSFITTDTTSGNFGQLGEFNSGGGYGVFVTLHEQGHALGFGHPGPYNGNAQANQQFSQYDNQTYTLMSYYTPGDQTQYTSPVSSNWNGQYATTWMPLDIDAIQRMYGAQTAGPLSTAQTFGYNTTITGSLRSYFDFSTINTPVVTLYNTAASGNRLDLSGSALSANLNLNPGAYSSTHGLTNNIAIYKTTYIQEAVLGAGDDVAIVNTRAGNTVDGGGGANTAVFAGNRAEYTVAQSGNRTTVTRSSSANTTERPNDVTDSLTNFQTLRFADGDVPVCFTTGTRILTTAGEMAVENLRAGDDLIVASGAPRRITWIGHRDLDGCDAVLPSDQQPIRIRAGAFGAGLPMRDLLLSPGHPVLVGADAGNEGGALVPIMCLINGTTITREPVTRVSYWHVELDAHDILLAEGLAAESYIDGGDRAFFVEGSDHTLHNPDFVPAGWDARCRPVAVDGPVVEAERARLDGVFAGSLSADCGWDANEVWLAA